MSAVEGLAVSRQQWSVNLKSILPQFIMDLASRKSEVMPSRGQHAMTDGHTTPTRLLRRGEAARYVTDTWGIPLSKQTLAKLAVVGGGPAYRKAGRFPLYDPSDLDDWASSKLGPKQRSTADGLRAAN